MEGVAGESIVRVVISEAVSLGTWDLYFAPDSEEPEALTAYTTPPPLQPQLVYPRLRHTPPSMLTLQAGLPCTHTLAPRCSHLAHSPCGSPRSRAAAAFL